MRERPKQISGGEMEDKLFVGCEERQNRRCKTLAVLGLGKGDIETVTNTNDSGPMSFSLEKTNHCMSC